MSHHSVAHLESQRSRPRTARIKRRPIARKQSKARLSDGRRRADRQGIADAILWWVAVPIPARHRHRRGQKRPRRGVFCSRPHRKRKALGRLTCVTELSPSSPSPLSQAISQHHIINLAASSSHQQELRQSCHCCLSLNGDLHMSLTFLFAEYSTADYLSLRTRLTPPQHCPFSSLFIAPSVWTGYPLPPC